MNAIELAHQGYAPTQTHLRNERSTELQLFGEITARLKNALADGSKNHPKLVAALHQNRQLWNTIAIDVANDENALPKQLRAQLFYLAEFTQLHTSKVLRHEADVTALIDINRAIIAGLGQSEHIS